MGAKDAVLWYGQPMTPAKKWLPALCLFLLAAAPCAAATAAKPDTVALSFGWKPGLRASVTSTSTRIRVTDERTERSATWHSKLRVDPDPDGVRIGYDDPTFEFLGARADSAVAARVGEQLAGLFPDFVVASDGGFKRIHDVSGFQGRLRALLHGALPPGTDSSALKQTLSVLTGESFLTSKAAEQWNALVGTWAGGKLELGETYTSTTREPIAMFPGEVVQMNYEFIVKRRVSCTRAGATRRCIEVQLRSVADPEDMKRMMQTFFDKLAGGTPVAAATFRQLEIENVILLVTEPNGLIPHHLKITKNVRGVVAAEGRELPIQQADETVTDYVYP